MDVSIGISWLVYGGLNGVSKSAQGVQRCMVIALLLLAEVVQIPRPPFGYGSRAMPINFLGQLNSRIKPDPNKASDCKSEVEWYGIPLQVI